MRIIAALLFLMSCAPQSDKEVVYAKPLPYVFEFIYLIEIADEQNERDPKLLALIENPDDMPPFIESEIGWRCLKLKVNKENEKPLKYISRVAPKELNKTCQGLAGFTVEELTRE